MMQRWGVLAFILLYSTASGQNLWTNVAGTIRYVRGMDEYSPESLAEGSFVTLTTSLDDDVMRANAAYDPRLQARLLRREDPRTIANDAMTYALGQGTIYNNQPEPAEPPAPEPPEPPAPVAPLAIYGLGGQ